MQRGAHPDVDGFLEPRGTVHCQPEVGRISPPHLLPDGADEPGLPDAGMPYDRVVGVFDVGVVGESVEAAREGGEDVNALLGQQRLNVVVA